MKGIVAEINGKYAIILTKTGSFVKVKAALDMVIGQEVDLNRPAEGMRRRRLATKITSIAAAGLLAFGVGYAGYCYTLPYSYVHVDINPSIELTANIYDRIIGVEALNSSGEELIDASNLKYHKVDTAVKQLLNAAVEHGYLGSDNLKLADEGLASDKQQTTDQAEIAPEGQALDKPVMADINQAVDKDGSERSTAQNAVLLTVSSSSSRKATALRENIGKAAIKELEKEKVESEILIGEASVEQRNDARRFGVTPGKLVLIEDALEMGDEPASQIRELKKAPIKDLLKKASDKAEEKSEREEEKAKQEEQKAKEKARQEDQRVEEKTKQDEQKAKEKVKQEEQKDRERAKREEQEAKEQARQEEQKERERAKREEQKAKERASQEEQKAKEKSRQDKSGKSSKSSWNDAAQKHQTQKNSSQSNSTKSDKDAKNNSKKTHKDLKDEREKLREDLLGQLKGRQDNNYGNQYQRDGEKDSQNRQSNKGKDQKRE